MGVAALHLVLVLVIRSSLVVEARRYENAFAARWFPQLSRAGLMLRLPATGNNSFVVEVPAAWAGNAACPESLPVVESMDPADHSCPTGNRRS